MILIIGIFLMVVGGVSLVLERRQREKAMLFGMLPPPVAGVHAIWLGLSMLVMIAALMLIICGVAVSCQL